MKRHVAILPWVMALLLLAVVVLPSCGMYEDGPSISFKSREERVKNSWQAEIISRNEIDVTKSYEYMHLDFRDGGAYEMKAKKVNDAQDTTFTGTWELATLDQQIKVDYTDPLTFQPRLLYFDIRRLTEDEMRLDYIWQGNKFALSLIPR